MPHYDPSDGECWDAMLLCLILFLFAIWIGW